MTFNPMDDWLHVLRYITGAIACVLVNRRGSLTLGGTFLRDFVVIPNDMYISDVSVTLFLDHTLVEGKSYKFKGDNVDLYSTRWTVYPYEMVSVTSQEISQEICDRVQNYIRCFSQLLGSLKKIDESISDYTVCREQLLKSQKNERLLTSLMNYLPAFAFVNDSLGRYIYVNKTLSDTWNWSEDYMIGKTNNQLFPNQYENVENWEKTRLEVMSGKTVKKDEQVVYYDGTKKYFVSVKFPLRDNLGQIYALGGISFDITDRKKVEEELKVERNRFSTIVNTSEHAIQVYDGDGNMRVWNKVTEKMFNMTPSQLKSTRADKINLTRSVHLPRKIKDVVGGSSGGSSPFSQHLIQNENGQDIWLTLAVFPLTRDATDKVIEVLVVMVDITLKKKNEKKLLDTSNRFRTIFENSPLSMYIINENGNLILWNRAFLELWGIPPSEYTKLSELNFLKDKQFQQQGLTDLFYKAFSSQGDKTVPHTINFEPIKTGVLGRERTVSHFVYPLTSTNEHKEALFIGIDETEQERKRLELAESEARFRTVFEECTLCLMLFDNKGWIRQVNKEYYNMWQTHPSQFESVKETYNILTNEYAQRNGLTDLMKVAISGKSAYQSDIRIDPSVSGYPGKSLLVEVYAYPIFLNEKALPDEVLFVFIDITEKRENEKLRIDLESDLKSKKDIEDFRRLFLMSFSHEMKTPLNAIMGIAREIKEDQRDSTLIDIIIDNSLLLIRMMDDLIDLQKMERGDFRIVPVVFTSSQLLSILEHTHKSKGDLVRLQFLSQFEGILTFYSDMQRILQVINIFVTNSLQYTSAGSVTVELVSKNPEYLDITIRDTSPGISESGLASLMNGVPVTSGNTSDVIRSASMKMAKSLVEKLGGKMEVSSSQGSQDHGMTVVIKFRFVNYTTPSTPPTPAITPPVPEQHEEKYLPLKGVHVAVVDDNLINLKIMRKQLERLGMTVTDFDNADDLISSVTEKKLYCDVIFMDLMMPKKDGYTASNDLRNAGVTVPIIAYTAHAVEGELDNVKKAGMDDIISKPFKTEDLISKVKALLHRV